MISENVLWDVLQNYSQITWTKSDKSLFPNTYFAIPADSNGFEKFCKILNARSSND